MTTKQKTEARAEAAVLAARVARTIVNGKPYKGKAKAKAKPITETHGQKVKRISGEAIREHVSAKHERARKKEIERAKTAGLRAAWRDEIGGAGKASDAQSKALDAEADASERTAKGELPEAQGHHAEYHRLMQTDAQAARTYWREHENEIRGEVAAANK
jgi:hypothetical protein